MVKLTLLLVGTHFHPPAVTLLATLPAGVPLGLCPEPENPYDPDAVLCQLPAEFARWLQGQSLEITARLEEALPQQGVTLEQLLSTLPCVLGHVGKSGGKPLAKAASEAGMPELAGNREILEANGGDLAGYSARLAFAPSGSPLIEVEFSE